MKRKPLRNTYWSLMMMSRVWMLSLPIYALRFLFFFKSPYLPFFLVHSKISMVLQLASPFFSFFILSPWFLVSKILWLVLFHVVATVLSNKICFLRNWITWWTRRARFQQSSSHMHTCIGWLWVIMTYLRTPTTFHLPSLFVTHKGQACSFFPLII